MTTLLYKQEHKIKNISNDLEEKVSLTDYHELRNRIAKLEFEKKAKKIVIAARVLLQKANPSHSWFRRGWFLGVKTKTQTLDIFNKFMTGGLGLDPKSISVVDIHRLPQRPIVKQGSNITRPIIIKLTTAFDKRTVMSNLKNLNAYNSKKQVNFNNEHFHADSSHRNSLVFITDHLPKEFYERKKKLMPTFKPACKSRKKTRWAIHNGEYCLFVDNKLVTM